MGAQNPLYSNFPPDPTTLDEIRFIWLAFARYNPLWARILLNPKNKPGNKFGVPKNP